MIRSITVVVAGLLVLFAAAEPARASAILIMVEGTLGSNTGVVLSGSGSFDLTDLSPFTSGLPNVHGFLSPFPIAAVLVGEPGPADADVKFGGGLSGPTSFGTKFLFNPPVAFGSGDRFGISDLPFGIFPGPFLFVPNHYISGSPLNASNIFAGETLDSLGVTLGTYVWTWGIGAHADSLTLQIGTAATPSPVPEPASMTLLGLGLAGLSCRRWRHRRSI